MDINNLLGNSNIFSFIYYSGTILAAVFFAGWWLNTKLKTICAENNAELEKTMQALTARIDKLEKDYIPMTRYESDLQDLKSLITNLQIDMKAGLVNLTTRIDLLMTKGV